MTLSAACVTETTPPKGAPWLAVVVEVDAPDAVTQRGPYTFRVKEFSGTLPIDTIFQATPRDTVIISVEPASYLVEIGSVPATCGVRGGAAQLAVVPANSNTTLARFSLTCRNALTIETLTDGFAPDTTYAYAVYRGEAVLKTGTLAGNDTILIDGLASARYRVGLYGIDPHCLVLSDGGDRGEATISDAGGATVTFRVHCNEASRQPKLANVRATYGEGYVGFVVTASDPDKDIERYSFNITDCSKHSVLPGGARLRGGFSGFENVSYRDTSVIVGAYEVSLTSAQLSSTCLELWVADERGNASLPIEFPLVATRSQSAPRASLFNATLVGLTSLHVGLQVTDPERDFVGVFTVYTLRDGIVIQPPDGQLDRIIFHPPGILGSDIPDIPFGIGYGQWSDYYGVTVYLVDRAGNVERRVDEDLFR